MRSIVFEGLVFFQIISLFEGHNIIINLVQRNFYGLVYFSLELVFDGLFFVVLPINNMIYMQCIVLIYELWPRS